MPSLIYLEKLNEHNATEKRKEKKNFVPGYCSPYDFKCLTYKQQTLIYGRNDTFT